MILVAEDEAPVRVQIVRVLQQAVCSSLAARLEQRALALFTQSMSSLAGALAQDDLRDSDAFSVSRAHQQDAEEFWTRDGRNCELPATTRHTS
jgi:CheY-like chemotaxis protein